MLWLKEQKDERVFLNTATFYYSLFKSFIQVYQEHFILYDWVGCEKNVKGHFMYYLCCSNPTHVNGYFMQYGEGVRNYKAPYALKLYYFQEETKIDVN